MSYSIKASPTGHLRLHFQSEEESNIPISLSAIEQIGNTLWLAGDESTSVERLISQDHANYGDHQSFDLGVFFELPKGADQEIDLEGLSWDQSSKRLWLVGSHSWRRKQPKPGASNEKAFKALSTVDRQANRYLLGSIELGNVSADDGEWTPIPGSGRAAGFSTEGSSLISQLQSDGGMLAPFLNIPSKDNGFDIEGLAVKDDTVLIGLRGPVLRGWTSVLRFQFEQGDGGTLVPKQAGNHRYLHHVLDLGGLGVRDLCVCGNDILVLAGPTMELDGPMRVFRWRDAFELKEDTCIDGSQLQMLFEVPWGDRVDHAEGLAVFDRENHAPQLLVVYDSPAKGRLHDGRYFEADLFPLS